MIDQKAVDAAREALYRIAPEWDQHGDYGTLLVFISEVEAAMKAEPVAGTPRPHLSSKDCWCNPELTYTDPVTGASVWVHKEPM